MKGIKMPIQAIFQRTKNLVDVAMGRKDADVVVKNGRWVCVQSGEIVDHTDIAITDDRIAYVGSDASHTVGAATRQIDCKGKYLVPGLLDAHMHIESGMITITEFVRAIASRGTTGIFVDPHEIANVFGLNGVRLMVEEASVQPIHVWVQMPSCVPSAPGLETPGAIIGPDEVAEAMDWEGIIGLGEVMNFPGVFNGDEKMHAEMAHTRKSGKVIGGHYAAADLGHPFHGYVAGGPEDDHEGTCLEDAIARVRQGMKPMLRYGSGWLDVADQIRAVTEKGLDPRHFILCTDDSHAETLITEGHMNRVVRHAIAQGVTPMTALQMATINTATHFGVGRDVGMIAPGRFADILVVSNLPEMVIDLVIAKGEVIAQKGQLQIDPPSFTYPAWVTASVHLNRELTVDDFILSANKEGPQTANVIGIIENQAPTKRLRMEVEVKNGQVAADIKNDLVKVALVSRHKGTDGIQLGLVHGFGLTKPCAIGTTVAHDCHHMLVIGTSDADMARVANHLAAVGGGQAVCLDGEMIGKVDLPIAGLMSNEPAAVVAEKAATVLEGFRVCGCRLNNPNMQLSLMALVVIPELRISDLGLVDVNQFDFIPVLESG